MPMKLNSSGGGSVTVQAPSTAANRTVTLPDADDTLVSKSTPVFTAKVDTGAVGQVQFPATQNPSADPNCLDDYEEGTWTPTDASGAGLSLTVNYSWYTKVGRLVTVAASITWPTTANASQASISGLPFSVTSASIAPVMTNASVAVGGIITASPSLIALYNPTTLAIVTNATLSGKVVYLTASYTV